LLLRVRWLVGINVLLILLGSLESIACGQSGEVSTRPRRARPSGIITTRILAHAVYILGDLTRARMVEESIHQTNKLFLLHIRKYGCGDINPEIRQRIVRRDFLLQELEEEAEAVEELV
jgi:hypothetical protein